jgi:hypothetical protein
MRRLARLTPGTVLGVAAVVLALGGSAIAAKSYVITSKGQIAPSVRKALKGNTGKAGKIGKTGRTGVEGPRGPEGSRGPQGAQGEHGAVSIKTFTFDGPNSIPENFTNFQSIVAPIPGPGNYLGIAKLAITPDGPGKVTCSLFPHQSTIGGFDVSSIQGDDIQQTMTLTFPGRFPGPLAPAFAGFVVLCSTPAGTSAEYQYAKVNLIQSDEIGIAAG